MWRVLVWDLRWVHSYVVLGLVLWMLLACFRCEQAFRWAGGSLQTLGLLLVFVQLYSTARRFNRPPPLEGFRNWFAKVRVAFGWRRIVSASAISLGSSTAAGTSFQAVLIKANPTLKDRVDALEKEVTRLQTLARENHVTAITRIDALQQQTNDITSSMRSAHAELSGKLEDHAVGDLSMAFAGIGYTLVGTILATLAGDMKTCAEGCAFAFLKSLG
jgi:hypothetical protein